MAVEHLVLEQRLRHLHEVRLVLGEHARGPIVLAADDALDLVIDLEGGRFAVHIRPNNRGSPLIAEAL